MRLSGLSRGTAFFYTSDYMQGAVRISHLRTELDKRHKLDLEPVDIPHDKIIFEKYSMDKTKVVHGGDFRDRWKGVYITEDQFNYCYETSESDDMMEQLLFNEFECHGFSFDSDIHEEI